MELTERVEELADKQGVSQSEILEKALEEGVKNLWNEYVLSNYIEGEIDRDEAIELVGLEKVKRADREMEAVKEDIEWGMNA